MSEVYESLINGLNEALAVARGEENGAVVHHVALPTVDVAAIRANIGLSQTTFGAESASPTEPCSTGETVVVAQLGQHKDYSEPDLKLS